MGTERHSLCTKAPKFLQRDITWSHSILNLFKTNNRENCEYCPTQVSWKSELSIMPVVSVVSVMLVLSVVSVLSVAFISKNSCQTSPQMKSPNGCICREVGGYT